MHIDAEDLLVEMRWVSTILTKLTGCREQEDRLATSRIEHLCTGIVANRPPRKEVSDGGRGKERTTSLPTLGQVAA